MRLIGGDEAGQHGTGGHLRDLYVWTDQRSAVDAYEEALRVVESWPMGTRPVDVVPVGMYVPATTANTGEAAD